MTGNAFAIALSIALFQEEGFWRRRVGSLGRAEELATDGKRSEFTQTWTVVFLRFASVFVLTIFIVIGVRGLVGVVVI